MENKNTGIIVLLILVIIGLGGYLIYDKAIKEEEKIEVTNENSEKVEKEENEEISCTNDYKTYVNLYSNKERYYDEVDTTYGGVEQLGFDKLVINSSNQVLVYNYSSSNKGKELENKYGKNYVLTDNALKLYSFNYGNAGSKAIIILKTDGTLSILSPSQVSATSINWSNNIGNLTNIIDIYKKPVYMENPEGKFINGSSIVAIDTEGKEYELNNYLK